MSVTAHVMPKVMALIMDGSINLSSGTYEMGLCTTGPSTTWTSTQWAYEYVSDITGAYTEVTSSGYSRQTLSGLSVSVSGDEVIWTCTSPVSFGSAITLSAASAFVYKAVGADTANPVVSLIDFGGTVSSTAGAWTYTVDSVNGLATVTCS